MKDKNEKVSGFAKRLKASRMLADKTQQQAADAIGISLRNYQRYESNETEPSLSKLVTLAKLYEKSTDSLLGIAPFSSNENGNFWLDDAPTSILDDGYDYPL